MSITAPTGFRASGIWSGIKDGGGLDLSLVAASSGPVSAAATFTTNKAAAAPVQVSRKHLVSSGGKIAAIIANSGGANCATGQPGLDAAQAAAAAVAAVLSVRPDQVLVCSTGLIGIPLDIESLLGGIGPLVTSLGSSPADGRRAAEAIMTTDTHPKEVVVSRAGFVVGGMAKGAGMIAPNMATMLAMLSTDAQVGPAELAEAFSVAVQESFNELTVDGCTSTNDTAIVLASGTAGPVAHEELVRSLREACRGLVEQMAADAEGTTRVCRIHVLGAVSRDDARRAGRRVAESLLVKTSLFGADPYWGRVLSELGSSGADFELDKVSIAYGETLVFAAGAEVRHDRAALGEYLSAPLVEITCDLGLGEASASMLTTDLGHGYIDENMRTLVSPASPASLAAVSGELKAQLLVEAIPYMRRFAGKIVVVKYGGNALFASADESSALELFAADVVLMHAVGMLPVVVHGGGPQIGEMMQRFGMTPQFKDGLRVTDAATLDIVRMVLVGKVNRDIVGAFNAHGPLAVGMSGEDAGFITASLRDPALGFVGDVASIDPSIIVRLTSQGLIPVIATIGSDANGQAYNINADTVAGALAEALSAEKFILLSDVTGIRADADDPESVIPLLSADGLDELIAGGVVREGMIPKALALSHAARHGVKSAHVLDGRVPHALLLELFTEDGVGTMVVGS